MSGPLLEEQSDAIPSKLTTIVDQKTLVHCTLSKCFVASTFCVECFG